MPRMNILHKIPCINKIMMFKRSSFSSLTEDIVFATAITYPKLNGLKSVVNNITLVIAHWELVIRDIHMCFLRTRSVAVEWNAIPLKASH